MNMIYADNNATTCVAPEVYEAMIPYLTTDYFNPSSMYEPAQLVSAAVARARKTIAGHLGAANAKEILFTSCATESNNAAIQGTLRANPGRKQIITTAVEHPAVLEVCKQLQRNGYDVVFLPVDSSGCLDVGEFVRALGPETLMVSVMHANNETGVVFPIEQLSRLAKETDPAIVFHTDATQSVGKLPIDVQAGLPHVDLLSFSGHKLHAPKGIGALYVRRGTPWRPLMIGGHQEDGRRGGTENVPYIVGLARAMDLAMENRQQEVEQIAGLRDRLEAGILERIPWVQVNGVETVRLPNTTNVSCHYIEGESILALLNEERICASSGSACTSGSLEPSHVLQALHVPFTAMHGSVRFSFSRYNTEGDVERILDVFPRIVGRLRDASPYWDAKNNQPRPGTDQLIVKK